MCVISGCVYIFALNSLFYFCSNVTSSMEHFYWPFFKPTYMTFEQKSAVLSPPFLIPAPVSVQRYALRLSER